MNTTMQSECFVCPYRPAQYLITSGFPGAGVDWAMAENVAQRLLNEQSKLSNSKHVRDFSMPALCVKSLLWPYLCFTFRALTCCRFFLSITYYILPYTTYTTCHKQQ